VILNNYKKILDQVQLNDEMEPFPGYSESYLPGGLTQEDNTSIDVSGDETEEISLNQQESMRYAFAAFKKPNYFCML
jgi:hypothetical protein